MGRFFFGSLLFALSLLSLYGATLSVSMLMKYDHTMSNSKGMLSDRRQAYSLIALQKSHMQHIWVTTDGSKAKKTLLATALTVSGINYTTRADDGFVRAACSSTHDFSSHGLFVSVQSSMSCQKCATTDLSTCLLCGSILSSVTFQSLILTLGGSFAQVKYIPFT